MNTVCAKYVIYDSALYQYYLSNPENAFLTQLMNNKISRPIDGYYIIDSIILRYYRKVVKHIPEILYDIIINSDNIEKECIGRTAIEYNNKEIIELLHNNNLIYDYYDNTSPGISILEYAYDKHGSELIKFMCDIGVDFSKSCDFFNLLFNKRDIDLVCYLLQNSHSRNFDTIFVKLLYTHCNPELLVVFIDRINLDTHQDTIFHKIAKRPVYVTKFFLDNGMQLSDEALRYACCENNLDLIEFYLQCGLQVKADLLSDIIHRPSCRTKAIFKLFLKYNVDFSLIQSNDVDNAFYNDLEDHGLDKNTLLHLLIGPH